VARGSAAGRVREEIEKGFVAGEVEGAVFRDHVFGFVGQAEGDETPGLVGIDVGMMVEEAPVSGADEGGLR